MRSSLGSFPSGRFFPEYPYSIIVTLLTLIGVCTLSVKLNLPAHLDRVVEKNRADQAVPLSTPLSTPEWIRHVPWGRWGTP